MLGTMVATVVVMNPVRADENDAGEIGASPTYSLEAVAINGRPISGGPVQEITISPGERFTARIYLRDWSPEGDPIRAYQADLDDASFTSGTSGFIKPIGYDQKKEKEEENPEAAFVDEHDPEYIFKGQRIIPITDTMRAPGYRWMTVLIDTETAPVAKQDGTKFYCGTIKMEASADAEGLFTLMFMEEYGRTGVIHEGTRPAPGIQYERLKVNVLPGPRIVRIVSSDPPHGAVDPRPRARAGGAGETWSTIKLTFDGDAGGLSPGDFSIDDGTAHPPRIRQIQANESSVILRLDHDIKPARWTTVTLDKSGDRIRIGSLPGDVNGDGIHDASDLAAFLGMLNDTDGADSARADLNGDGRTAGDDILAFIEMEVSNQPAWRKMMN